MSTNTQSQGTSVYAKVQKEVKKELNKPAKILRPRQKPEWVEMYSSDEDIFAEKEPEEKKELITEFSSENAFADKKQSNLKDIKENLEKINITDNKHVSKELADTQQKTEDKKQARNVEIDVKEKLKESNSIADLNDDSKKEIIDANNNLKPKRKIHISVVVDNKKSENEKKSEKAADLNNFQKPEDILKRKIFEDADTNDDEIFKDLLNTENLKKKIIEEENKKRIEEENKKRRQMEELSKSYKDEEVKMDSGDDDIFANAGDDVKIDINKKIIEKYENKIKEKRLKESQANHSEMNLIYGSENVLRDEKKKKELERKYLSKPSTADNAVESPASDSDEEEEDLFRPIFKEKDTRITIKDLVTREAQEEKMHELEEKLKAQKKQDTKKLVIHYIKEDLSKQTVYDKEENLEMPNDEDDPDNLDEYEQWKIRELNRIRKQAEEEEMKLKEKLEIERRRNLSDVQRKEENLRLGSDDTLRPFKSKLKFLQKYYHKGAFFSNERAENMDHVLNRDYNLPTWEDKIDRSALPKILQKRRGLQFKKGQTKYTHLTSEDTTNFDPNFRLPENIHSKVMGYMGGLKAQDKFEVKGEYKGKGKK